MLLLTSELQQVFVSHAIQFVVLADWVTGIRTAISDTGNDYTSEPKTKETETRKHILLFCFLLFCSVSFNLFLCFFLAEIAETSHFRYKTENER